MRAGDASRLVAQPFVLQESIYAHRTMDPARSPPCMPRIMRKSPALPRPPVINDIRTRLRRAAPARTIPAVIGKRAFPGSPAEHLVRAAVLVGLVDRPGRPTILLTKRADDLPRHPSQVSFSGGVVEPDDEDEVACALRETEEEIGLCRRHVEVIGRLDTCTTGTGYAVMPVVGRITPGFTLTLARREVADAFEVPLAYLLDPHNHTESTRTTAYGEFRFYDIQWKEHRIWGATARMVVNLFERTQHP